MTVLGRTMICILAVCHVGIAYGQEAPTEIGGGTGTPSVTLPDTDVCGKRDDRFNGVVGVSDGEPGLFPWIAALGYRSSENSEVRWQCPASLVTDRHLVASTRCIVAGFRPYFRNTTGYRIVARLGFADFDFTEATRTWTDYEVDTFTLDQAHNTSRHVNDITIVRLKDKVTFSRLIQPICLPTQDEFRSKNFTGYAAYIVGAKDIDDGNRTILQQVQVRVWDQEKCKAAYSAVNGTVIDNRVLCAGDDGKNACQSDSSFALIMPYGPGSNYYLFGVSSYLCQYFRNIGLYTQVSEFMDWILPNLK